MPQVNYFRLEEMARILLTAEGATENEAQEVARHLARANLYGTDSHGVQLLPMYKDDIKKGVIRPGAEMVILKDTPSTVLIDARRLWGQIAGDRAMKMAIEKAKKMGVGLALIRNSSHFGAMWDFVEMVLEYNMIGWATSVCDPNVAPPGGAARVIGTNPMAFAIPAGKYNQIIIDSATSTSSVGKLKVYAAKGLRIPEGWIVDKEGKPTTDPNDFFRGGTLLTRGGYYGFAFSLVAEALAGVLSGFGCRPLDNSQGGFFEAIDISHFISVDLFKSMIDEHIDVIKNSQRSPGVTEITLPGEPELRTKEKRLREGIPIPDSTWGELIKLGQDVGVDVKKIALGT